MLRRFIKIESVRRMAISRFMLQSLTLLMEAKGKNTWLGAILCSLARVCRSFLRPHAKPLSQAWYKCPDACIEDIPFRGQRFYFISFLALFLSLLPLCSGAEKVPLTNGGNWCELSIDKMPVSGGKVNLKVNYKGVDDAYKPVIHLHWKDNSGKAHGFLTFVKMPKKAITGSGSFSVNVKIPVRKDLGAVSFVFFTSPDGSWKNRKLVAQSRYIGGSVCKTKATSAVQRKLEFIPDYYKAVNGKWSWQIPNAIVKPTGDLEWKPEKFVFKPGKSVRYIDYDNGSDDNDGTSKNGPWKHHPWDINATGKAKHASETDTYVFKRGVFYRGTIDIKRSGIRGKPIQLTSSPDWGQGEAVLCGSKRVTGWRRVSDISPGLLPNADKTWYVDLPKGRVPNRLFVLNGGKVSPMHIARTPNWKWSNPDNYRSEWFVWNSVKRDAGSTHTVGTDPQNLSALSEKALKGAVIWSEFNGVMGYAIPNKVKSFDKETGAVSFDFPLYRKPPVPNCRYYLENSISFLDSPGEFFVDKKLSRLYVRLPEDRDPRKAIVEVSILRNMVTIKNKKHIRISGLSFKFNNREKYLTPIFLKSYPKPAAILISDSISDFELSNCRFSYVVRALRTFTTTDKAVQDLIDVTDNYVEFASDGGFYFEDRYGVLFRLRVLRNRIRFTGLTTPLPAVEVMFARLFTAAGNIIDNCGGIGINLRSGKGGHIGEDHRDVPLVRSFIHHNKVTNALLCINDYGNIETWQVGPVYMYNNVSGNPGGYWHWRQFYDKDPLNYVKTRFGFAYYLDGSFKNYLFNNIAWGNNNELGNRLCNAAALQEIHGFENTFFNNTFYKFGCGSRRQRPDEGRCFYLGNLWLDMSDYYFHHDAWRRKALTDKEKHDFHTVGYAKNFFTGTPRSFGTLEYQKDQYKSLEQFSSALKKRQAEAADIGKMLAKSPLKSPNTHDFRPVKAAPVINSGVKFFVPWGLAKTVGEWNFYRFAPGAPAVVYDRSIYASKEYSHRLMYGQIPENNLACVNLSSRNFVYGSLENWTKGAMQFNGRNQYCVVKQAELERGGNYEYHKGKKVFKSSFNPRERESLDMTTGNFLLEVVFKTESSGTLLSKTDGKNGYELIITETGRLRIVLTSGDNFFTAESVVAVNDNRWHQAVVEIDRGKENGTTIYINGKVAETRYSGKWPAKIHSFTNRADFFVGKGPSGRYFKGCIDFLRVSRGTLKQSFCSIDDLYNWEFDGPFLYDFTGRRENSRDAGAIEYVNSK